MIINDNTSLAYEPVSSVFINTLMGAMTLLMSLGIRDAVQLTIQLMVPDQDVTKMYIFTVTLAIFWVTVSLVMAYSLQDRLG